MLTSIIEYLSVCWAAPFHRFRVEFFVESQTLVYASRRNCMKSRKLIKKMVRWNDPTTCDAAELGAPAPADVTGAIDTEGEVLDAGATELDDEGIAGAFDTEGEVLDVGAAELDDEGVVAGDEVEVVMTDVGVPGVVDEGAAAGLGVVNEVGVASG